MTRDEFEDAMRELATEVACGRGRGEAARNLAGALLAVWAQEATSRKAAARKAALSRWRGSGDDAGQDANYVERIAAASDNAHANGIERIDNASDNASQAHANVAPCKAVSSLDPDLQNRKQNEEKPRLLSLSFSSELPPAKPSRLSNARARKPPRDTSVAWNAYSVAYARRYGMPPTRNARGNGQLGQFMDRIPIEDVVVTIAHYLRSHNARYVHAGHSIGCLLQDAEKLRTEALTGRSVTASAARRMDRTADRSEQYDEMLGRLRAEDEAEEGASNGKAT